MLAPPDSAGSFGRQLPASKASSRSPMARNPPLLNILFLKRIEDLLISFVTLRFATATFHLRSSCSIPYLQCFWEDLSAWRLDLGGAGAAPCRAALTEALVTMSPDRGSYRMGAAPETDGNQIIRRPL